MTGPARPLRQRRPFRLELERQRFWLLAAAACLLAAVAVAIWDRPISAAARGCPALAESATVHEFLLLFRLLGKAEVLAGLALVLGLLGLRRLALEMLVAMAISAALVLPLKLIVPAERPQGGAGGSFPSGDAASATAAAAPLAARLPLAAPAAVAAVVLVGGSRVIYGRHYPSDVLVGIGLGLLACAASRETSRRLRLALRLGRVRRFALLAGVLLPSGLLAGALSSGGSDVERLACFYGPALALLLALRHARLVRRLRSGLRRRMWRPPEGAGAALLAAAAFAGVYALVAASSSLWDRDEPRFARATVEMLESGDYLVPTFNGKLRPDKPILIYWLMAAPARLLGQTELAFRLPAVLAAGAACLLTWWLARRMFGGGNRAGLLAMAALATSPLLMVSGTAATTDAVLLAFIVAALALLLPALNAALGWRRSALVGLLLGGALLTKGPVGLAVPLLALAAALVILRRRPASAPARSRLAPLFAATAVGFGLFLLWALPANAATSGEFARQGLGHHVLERMARPLESHGGSRLAYLPYYLAVVALGFFPWALFLPGALSALLGGRLVEPRSRALLLGWLATTFALMTAVKTKLPHYVLPMWPAMAILVAGVLQRRAEGAISAGDERWLRRGLWLFLPVGLALGLACLAAPWFLPIPKARGAFWALGLLVLGLTLVVRREHRARRHGSAAMAMIVGMVLLQFHASLVALPALERFKLSPAVAARVRERTAPGGSFAACRYCEPSLAFYARRRMETVSGNPAALSEWAARPGSGVLVVPRDVLDRAGLRPRELGLVELGSERGFNLGNGGRLELVALERPASKGALP